MVLGILAQNMETWLQVFSFGPEIEMVVGITNRNLGSQIMMSFYRLNSTLCEFE